MNKDKKQWVIWKAEHRSGKITKIPYTKNNTMSSSTDPAMWCTYKEAVDAQKQYNASGVGYVLHLDGSLLFIDLDKCLKDGDIINKQFKELVKKADTYTEISPSGTGLHLFFTLTDFEKYSLPKHRSKKCPGFEIYKEGRYATYTGNIFNGKDEIKEISTKKLEQLLQTTIGYPWNEEETNKKKDSKHNLKLDDQEIISRMFASKNGNKIQDIYNGTNTEYNDDESSADMALCMHLAFWTMKDKEQMRTLWLNSPLGQRKKTQDRIDYQNMTLDGAIQKTHEVYSPRDPENLAKAFELQTDQKGRPFVNILNLSRIVEKDELISKSIRFNSFSEEEETNIGTKYSDVKEWRPIKKSDIIYITKHIQANYPYFEKVSIPLVADSIILYAKTQEVNEIVDWLKTLEWDGEHRLDHWLTKTFGVPDDAYHSAVGANWFKGLVTRIMHPGSKFDHLIVLEGPQGWKKSTSFHVLGKGYHTETVLSPDNKDFFMLLKSNIIVEFSEGYTMSRSDSRLLKSIITMQEDQYRVPFGTAPEKFKRRCVFAMTTNEDQYLRDETGNRRYLPVKLEKMADIEWLEFWVDQLYAEAYQRAIIDKESYWDFPLDETEAIQNNRMVDNAYAEKLVDWYAGLPESERVLGITTLEAYKAVWQDNLSFGKEMHQGMMFQVTSLFKNVLFLVKKKTMINNVLANRWFPTDKTRELFGFALEEEQEVVTF